MTSIDLVLVNINGAKQPFSLKIDLPLVEYVASSIVKSPLQLTYKGKIVLNSDTAQTLVLKSGEELHVLSDRGKQKA